MDVRNLIKANFAFDIGKALDEEKRVKPLVNFNTYKLTHKIYLDNFINSLFHAKWANAETAFYLVVFGAVESMSKDIRDIKGLTSLPIETFAQQAIALLCHKIDNDPLAGPLEKYTIKSSEVYKKWESTRKTELDKMLHELKAKNENRLISV